MAVARLKLVVVVVVVTFSYSCSFRLNARSQHVSNRADSCLQVQSKARCASSKAILDG